MPEYMVGQVVDLYLGSSAKNKPSRVTITAIPCNRNVTQYDATVLLSDGKTKLNVHFWELEPIT
jgi:hypothetical protein